MTIDALNTVSHQGKVVSRTTRGHSRDIIGKEFSDNLFGAAYEYTKSDGTSEVQIFQKVGRVRTVV